MYEKIGQNYGNPYKVCGEITPFAILRHKIICVPVRNSFLKVYVFYKKILKQK